MTDPDAYRAGQETERRRLQLLIDVRIDQLQRVSSIKDASRLSAELLRLRQQIYP